MSKGVNVLLVLAVCGAVQFGSSSVARAQADPEWDAAWALLNRPGSEGGCVGCHIRDTPLDLPPWWGPDQATVLNTLETAISPDPMQPPLDPMPILHGRNSYLVTRLAESEMPLGGMLWPGHDDWFQTLGDWLIRYDDPPDPCEVDPNSCLTP